MPTDVTAQPRKAARRAKLACACILALVCLLAPAAGRASAAATTVSLTFDDGSATEYWTLQQLASHNMNGTFYINSARVGTSSYYMDWNQIQALYAAGNEIGGHTAMHDNLPQTDPNEAQRQICNDRVNLINKGFQPTDFAYPYGAFTPAIETMVQNCGYNSARTTGTVVSDPIPPPDVYAIPQSPGTDLASAEAAVTNAEQHGGGWVILVFHQICNACDTNWFTQSDFTSLLDWLQPRSAQGTVVKTVHQVIGGTTKAAVSGPAAPPAPNGFKTLRNPSVEYDSNADSAPDCWQFDGFGNNTATWTRTTDSHTGGYAERVDMSNYTDGDAKLETAQDLGYCTPTVTPGHSYVISEWYKSTTPVDFTAFTRDSLGAFSFWTGSPTFPASAGWTQATWTTPVIPSGVTGLSFGMTITANGSLTVDDATLADAAPTGVPDTLSPSASITAPTAGSTVAGTVPITATASDNISVDHLDFLIDGAVVGTVTQAPYTYSWNARKVANGFHTIAVRAVDPSGNATTTSAMTVNVSNSSTNLLANSNPGLETATGGTPDCWLLGGYGNNSFTWTRTTDAHSGGFAETLAVSSWSDGDRKLVTQQGTGPCVPAGTPGHSYTASAYYKVPTGLAGQPVFFAYYKSSAGVWTYWAQSAKLANVSSWTQATWSTPALPAGATGISVGLGLNAVGSVTMDDFALFDNTPPPDVTPPTTTINCNGQTDAGGCATGYYGGPVQVSLAATDDAGGSGVAQIRYTTNGTDPTSTTGSVYSGPFSVGSTTTVKYRAFDVAGNAEAVHSQLIQIDTTPPSSTITCNTQTCQSGWYNTSVSVALSAVDSGGAGVAYIQYTTDGTDPTVTNGNTYLGPFSATSTATVKYRAYDNAGTAEAVHSQLIQIDTTSPSSSILCGLAACATTPYQGSVSASLTATDDGSSGVASIRYTTDGTDPTSTNGTVYTGPFTLNTTTTVKYRAFDNAGNVEPVNSQLIKVGVGSVVLTSPADGAAVSGTTNFSATVNGITVNHVDFLVDGTVVATDTSAPYTYAWDSTTVSDGPHTVVAHAFDASSVETDSDPATITVSNHASDTTPPVSTIACNGAPCSTGSYNASVSVQLSATDEAGGSGIASIIYTTDGSDPTMTNGFDYGGAFSMARTTLVKYRAFDNAGNAEAVNSQLIQIDTVAPVSSIFCNGVACSGSYYNSNVAVSLAASDSGGSGVAVIRYTTDGSDPTTTNGSDYSSPLTLTGNTTVKYRAYDAAGNVEPVNSALIHVDTMAPVSTIKCNGVTCAGAYFKPGASVTLAATDADSGVGQIRYTTDGTDPTSTTGTVYAGAFTVNAVTTVKYRAFDNVGNAEAVNTQIVQIDGTPPSASITSPTNGSLVAGTVPLSANASDNVAVDHVDFLVDGATVATDTTAPYTGSWSSASVADGTHTITARATDSAGNTTTSSAVSVVTTNNNRLSNPGLETATGTTPTCWLLGGYGNNTVAWTHTSDANTGNFGELLNITSYTDGDRKLVSAQDTGACAPTASPGHTYTVTGYYKATAQPVFFGYYRSSAGVWTYWAQSAKLAVTGTWTKAAWTTPAVPSGATNLSVGIGLQSAGTVTMDDFGLFATG